MAKASMHTGKKLSIAHNLRTYEKGKWNTDGHIDDTLTPQNEVLCNTDLYEFFDKNFGDALVDFNEKNIKKHPDRLIGFVDKDELKNCTPMERKEYLAKAFKAYERATPSQRRESRQSLLQGTERQCTRGHFSNGKSRRFYENGRGNRTGKSH